jgi:hypothetical protein
MPPQSKGTATELIRGLLPALAGRAEGAQAEARPSRKKLARLPHSAAALGLTLVPVQ